VQLVGDSAILPDGKCPTTQFDQCCLPIDLHHRIWIAVGLVDGKTPKWECSPEDIVMPMCQTPRISDPLLQAGRPPANENHLPARTDIRSARKTNSTVKAGWQAVLILCAATLLLL
jgi:hypothetical protein